MVVETLGPGDGYDKEVRGKRVEFKGTYRSSDHW